MPQNYGKVLNYYHISCLFEGIIPQTEFVPGNDIVATSGTTMRVPVKSLLSPAWAHSTASALRITSTL